MHRPFDTIAVTVLDGVGCGEAADCPETYPEDRGTNSLLHASDHARLDAPALQSMGIDYIPGLEDMRVGKPTPLHAVRGAYGALEPTFAGKGSPEGHQALMGYEVQKPYLYFDKTGFPPNLIHAIEQEISRLLGRPVQVIRYPGTDDVSGTVFIEYPSIGPVHLSSTHHDTPLKLPVYASSDSVIQIAIHQEVLPQETIENIGRTVREKVCDALGYRVGRVIMRPFIGTPGNFERVSADRRDYAVDPDGPTIIDALTDSGIPVYGIGKAPDMLNHRGFPEGSTQKFSDDFERLKAIKEWFQGKSPHPNPLPHLRQGSGGQARGEGIPIIWSVTLSVPMRPKEEIRVEIERLIQKRIETQPHLKTAGSCFKSLPDGTPAWKLIDAAGLHGLQVGDIQVAEKHANFLLNVGKASFNDATTLVQKIQSRLDQPLDVEMRFVGQDGLTVF